MTTDLYEKDLFVNALSDIFNGRGNFNVATIGIIKDFFSSVKKVNGLLNSKLLMTMEIGGELYYRPVSYE